MVLFRITILLTFTKPRPRVSTSADDKSVTKKLKKKGNKESKSKKSKSNKSKKSSDKSSKKRSTVGKVKKLPDEDYIIEVGKPVGYAHIDYELIPSKIKYDCDIICWNSAVKVFTADGSKIYKTVSDEEKIYAYCTIEHKLKALSDDDVRNMQTRVIKFNIYTKKSKLKSIAKSDKTKLLYIRKEDVCSDYFVEAFNENPNVEDLLDEEKMREIEIEKFIQDILMICIRSPSKDEVVSYLNYEDELHEHIIREIVKETPNKMNIPIKEFTQVIVKKKAEKRSKDRKKKGSSKTRSSSRSASNKNKSSSKKSKGTSKQSRSSSKKSKDTSEKSKKSKKEGSEGRKRGNPHFLIPASVFITDSDLAVYELQNTSNVIEDGFLILSCDSPLSNAQKRLFNPLIFKLLKLERFPAELVTRQGFEQLHAYCRIPDVCEVRTATRDITDTVKFNESYLHFISHQIAPKLYQFMQSQHLIIEIWGEKSIQSQRPHGHIFSTEQEDINLSKGFLSNDCLVRLKRAEPVSAEPLAVACFDISSLLKRCITYKASEQCHQPGSTLYTNFPHELPCEYSDIININELHMSVPYAQKGIIPEFELAKRCTTLEISVALMIPQFANIRLHQCIDTFKRLFIIVYDMQSAALLLNDILVYNQEAAGPEYIAASFMKNSEIRKDENEEASLALTGFMIDNYEDAIFFIEGPSDGFILDIWNQVHNLDPAIASVFLNTDQVSDERLYSEFLPYQPIYTITLKIPLQEIFSRTWSFVRGHTPPPCYEAISKLNLLLNASSLKGMLQHNLLPTSGELMSFGTEFGVPLRWKGFRQSSSHH